VNTANGKRDRYRSNCALIPGGCCLIALLNMTLKLSWDELVECVNRFAPMTHSSRDCPELLHIWKRYAVLSSGPICVPPLWGLPPLVFNGVHESKGLTAIW